MFLMDLLDNQTWDKTLKQCNSVYIIIIAKDMFDNFNN